MTSLLDVNVLIALLDPSSVHHDAAHEWFGASRSAHWATCPITENGCARVISNPKYAGNSVPVREATVLIAQFCEDTRHEFWPDDISLFDKKLFRAASLPSHGAITDCYLLALAVKHSGRLVTFDQGIPARAIEGADKKHLTVIAPRVSV